MKKSKIISVIVIIPSLLFTFCDKRPFAHIEVHGRIANYKTNQPLQAQVQLWVGGGTPGEKGTTQYASTTTNGDGSFDIKTNAQWSGNSYKLQILPDSLSTHEPSIKEFNASRNQNVDVGTIGL